MFIEASDMISESAVMYTIIYNNKSSAITEMRLFGYNRHGRNIGVCAPFRGGGSWVPI